MANLSAEILLSWGGKEDRLFALKAKSIEELEHDTDRGIGLICYRVFSRVDYTFKELRQTIYWGLVGGGESPAEATRLVRLYVDDCPIDPPADPSSTLKTASAILKAVHFGWERLPPAGEGQAGTQ